MLYSLKNISAVTIAVLMSFAVTSPNHASAETNVLFIFDASGSMKKPVEPGGPTRLDVAKQAMSRTLRQIPSDVRLGLFLYGHRRAKDCTDMELVSPIGAENVATIATRIERVRALGETPIAESLRQAVRSFATLRGQSNRIVLVTDGIEECGGDPCAAARSVVDAGLDLKVDVVGFTLDETQRATVQCVADLTGGSYHEARNPEGLVTALAEVQRQVAQGSPPVPTSVPERLNLISPKNGGGILLAPSDPWLATADDLEDAVTWMRDGQEGVFGFKDDLPATFDTFAVLVHAAGGNPKEIELLAGDDGPTGEFRPIATCSFVNAKQVRTPYQECRFPPVTARYLKAKIISSHGDGYVLATEWQVLGHLSE